MANVSSEDNPLREKHEKPGKGQIKNRENRNKSEKDRRDKLNNYIHELAVIMAPEGSSPSKKLDKASILKNAVDFMKIHNDLTVSITGNDTSMFLSSDELGQLMLEGCYAFLFAITLTGTFTFLSESTQDVLGYSKNELLEKNILEYINPEDKPVLIKQLNNNAATGRTLNAISSFYMRLKTKLGNEEEYVSLRCSGDLRVSKTQVKQETTNEDLFSETYFVILAETVKPSYHRNTTTWVDDVVEFDSRQSLDGKFLFLDPRCIKITGYLPYELLGSVMYEYIHCDDLQSIQQSFQALIECGEGTTEHYRILTKGCQWIVIQTTSYISYNHWNSKPEFICSTHQLNRNPAKMFTNSIKKENIVNSNKSDTELGLTTDISSNKMSPESFSPKNHNDDSSGEPKSLLMSPTQNVQRSYKSSTGLTATSLQPNQARTTENDTVKSLSQLSYPATQSDVSSNTSLQAELLSQVVEGTGQSLNTSEYFQSKALLGNIQNLQTFDMLNNHNNPGFKSRFAARKNQGSYYSSVDAPGTITSTAETFSTMNGLNSYTRNFEKLERMAQTSEPVTAYNSQQNNSINDRFPQSFVRAFNIKGESQTSRTASFTQHFFSETSPTAQLVSEMSPNEVNKPSQTEFSSQHKSFPAKVKVSQAKTFEESLVPTTKEFYQHAQSPQSVSMRSCQSPGEKIDQYPPSPLSIPNRSFQSTVQVKEQYPQSPQSVSMRSPQSPQSVSMRSPRSPQSVSMRSPQSPQSVSMRPGEKIDQYPPSPLSMPNRSFQSTVEVKEQYPQSPQSVSMRSCQSPGEKIDQYPPSPLSIPNRSFQSTVQVKERYPQSPQGVSNGHFDSPCEKIDQYPPSPLSVSNRSFQSTSEVKERYPQSPEMVFHPTDELNSRYSLSPGFINEFSNLSNSYPNGVSDGEASLDPPAEKIVDRYSQSAKIGTEFLANKLFQSCIGMTSENMPSPSEPGTLDAYSQSLGTVTENPYFVPSSMAERYSQSSTSIQNDSLSQSKRTVNKYRPQSETPKSSPQSPGKYAFHSQSGLPPRPLQVSEKTVSNDNPQSPARNLNPYSQSENIVSRSSQLQVEVKNEIPARTKIKVTNENLPPCVTQDSSQSTSNVYTSLQPKGQVRNIEPAVLTTKGNENTFGAMQEHTFGNTSTNVGSNIMPNVDRTGIIDAQKILHEQLVQKQNHLQAVIQRQKRQLTQIQHQICVNAQSQFTMHEVNDLEASEQLQREAEALELQRYQHEIRHRDLNFAFDQKTNPANVNNFSTGRQQRTCSEPATAFLSNYDACKTASSSMTEQNSRQFPSSSQCQPYPVHVSSNYVPNTVSEQLVMAERPRFPAPSVVIAPTQATSTGDSLPSKDYFSKFSASALQTFFSTSSRPEAVSTEQESSSSFEEKAKPETLTYDSLLMQQKQLLQIQEEQRRQVLMRQQEDEFLMLQMQQSVEQSEQPTCSTSLPPNISQQTTFQLSRSTETGEQSGEPELTPSAYELTEDDECVVNMLLAENNDLAFWSDSLFGTTTSSPI